MRMTVSPVSDISTHPGSPPPDVIVVEDTPTDRRLLREAFDEAGSDVNLRAYDNGDEAVTALLTLKDAGPTVLPHLLIADLQLPGRNGHEVIATLKADPALEWLPAVIITRSENEEDVRRSYAVGANAHLQKPAGFDGWVELAETIERFWIDRSITPPRGA